MKSKANYGIPWGAPYNVPIDDEHHWRYAFTFHAKAALPTDMMMRSQAAEKIEDKGDAKAEKKTKKAKKSEE